MWRSGAGQGSVITRCYSLIWSSFDLSLPSFGFGFGDAGGEVVSDFDEAGRCVRSGQSMGQRTQACSWMRGVEKGRAQVPMETLRRSKWPRNSVHSSSVGVRHSSVWRKERRRARKARSVAQDLNDRPDPEGVAFFNGEVALFAGGEVLHPDAVGSRPPLETRPGDGEHSPGSARLAISTRFGGGVASRVDCSDQQREHGQALTGAGVHA